MTFAGLKPSVRSGLFAGGRMKESTLLLVIEPFTNGEVEGGGATAAPAAAMGAAEPPGDAGMIGRCAVPLESRARGLMARRGLVGDD